MQARLANQRLLVNTYCMFDLRRHLRARPPLGPRRAFTVTRSGACIDLLDPPAATCLTTRMTLRLLVVLSAVVRVALPTAMTTVIDPDENPIFHLLMPHLNAAVSSRLDAIV